MTPEPRDDAPDRTPTGTFRHRTRSGELLTWTGTRPCVCTRCGLLFSGIKAFEAHLDRRGQPGGEAIHRRPEAVGLTRNAKGQWTDAADAQRAAARFERRRAA